MRNTTLLNRRSFRSTLSMPTGQRVEVRPPSLCHAPDNAWQRLMFWLLAPAPQDAAPPLNRLPAVRDDFVTALADIDSFDGRVLSDRVAMARSLRELWHLRADVYRLVAISHNQAVADERLAELSRHFPTRAPRSGFVPL